MNVWAIDKELRIKHFLVELVHRYGEDTFSLLEHPEQFQAVEIYLGNRSDLSAYIYTFAQPFEKYAIDLMFPLPEHDIIGENENLNLEQLFSILGIHFEL
ncbi:MAG: hypothetical protein ACU85E_13255 [Gammaproteobacteria bacterium]